MLGETTRVLVEQVGAVDVGRLGGHNSSAGSCMYGTTLGTNTPQVPDGDDFGELQYQIYNH